jgi:predicted amidohydrolase YtcJ
MVRMSRVLVIALLAGCVSPTQDPPPDAIYWNAVIHPVVGPRAEALAVRSGRIAAVGSNAAVKSLAGASTSIVDLGGKTVVPGLIDCHGHLAGLGSLLTGRLDLVQTKSYDQALAMVKERVAKAKPGEWILGGRWDQANWGDKDYPTHERLSAVSPDHPVWLTRVDGHMGLANRKAMDLAGITRSTPNPAGGEILKGSDGEPNGLFVDNAEDLIAARIRGGRAGFAEMVLAAQQACLKVGLTGVHDAGVSPSEFPTYRALDEDGRLKLRVYAMVSGGERTPDWFAKNPPHRGRRLTIRACKMFIDGAMGSRGAWLLEPYADRPGYTGLPVTPPDVLRRVTEAGLRHGYQICTHAIGDRGCRETLDAYEAAMKAVPSRDPRLRVEHAQNPAVADIPRFARLGVIASMQQTHATSDMRWAEDRVGPERVKGAYAWRKFLDAGARIAGGSDFPVEGENPLWGFYSAVTRQDHEGRPEGGWKPEERMTREEALRSFTLDAAYASFEESERGSLEPGKLADFVVFTKDILAVPAREILATECVLTVIGGDVVYRSPKR